MSVLHRIGSWFAIHEDEDEELYEEEPAAARRNVVPLSGREGRRLGAEVAVFMPRSFGDVTEIADALRGGRVVIVNLQGVERPLLQRVVDFTSGVAYTLDGKIQKLADSMYLVVPAGVNVNSQGLRESLIRDGSLDFMTDRG
ncbi:MAG: cell division protein SepF [Candidatus Eremiobacteraeota bacterium]|nr:cell division protein SepF [Candidatus Eremiobacteraeota bacterium]